MHITLAVSLAALAAPFAAPEPNCTIAISRSFRPSGALEMTLRSTPEMLLDRHGMAALHSDVRGRGIASWDTATVFGQVFELADVEADPRVARLRGHQRVVLVWWRYGAVCEVRPPAPGPRQDVDQLFVLAMSQARGGSAADLRPDSLWIGGLPTFDMSVYTWTYSPQERRPANLSPNIRGALTIAEYRDYFAHLPLEGSSREEREASWRRLLAWAEADPRRWTLYPSDGVLCGAVINLQASAAWRHRCPQ